MHLHLVRICFVVLLSFGSLFAQESEPPALYLTWQRDPATTMTIHWHTVTASAASQLSYRERSSTNWLTATGRGEPMVNSSNRVVHTLELTGLKPKTDYRFRFAVDGKEYKFRTMPADLSEPVRFISTGDLYHQKDWLIQMTKLAAKMDPAFVAIGGDIAYDNVKPELVGRWYDLFEIWKNEAIAPDGRLIPMLVAIGNHEVRGYWHKTPAEAPLFYQLFAMPGKQGYNQLDFGKYMTLLLLDSGHTHPVDGAQAEWLKKTLAARSKVPHIFPIYHIPGYPSSRPFSEGENGPISVAIREHWSPLFEKYGVKVSFENHEHAYKRTHPIKEGKVNPNGVVYLGDGAFGVRLRETHPVDTTWYLAKAGPIRHFYLATVYQDQRHIVAIDENGRIFDELYQRVSKK